MLTAASRVSATRPVWLRRLPPHRTTAILRALPTLVAAAASLAYVLTSPPSYDLAAQLFRAHLFAADGFGLWDNFWYSGHDTLGYSVLFPPLAALLSPQVVAAIAATASAALFERVGWRWRAEQSLVGALWFALAMATNLLAGRLTFAFGLMFAIGVLAALQARRPGLAIACALLSGLGSPVAALFSALLGIALAVSVSGERGDRRRLWTGVAVAAVALLPVLLLSVVFPEGGVEPFAASTFLPIPIVTAAAVWLIPRRHRILRIGCVLYGAGCLVAFAVPSPIGGNASRLGTLVAGPLAALLLWRRRTAWLLVAAIPLLYLQWQGPIGAVVAGESNPAQSASYWAPLVHFMQRRGPLPFRIEIPFTSVHSEAFYVASHVPLARGWERQLDTRDNALFYREGALTAGSYARWLHRTAVRYVAVADTSLDPSAVHEVALIDSGLPYLREVWHDADFRVYAVRHPASLTRGPGTVTALSANSVTIHARRRGRLLLRVHWSPYWALEDSSGCVAPAGADTALTLPGPGTVTIAIDFSLDRVGAESPRCSHTNGP